MRHVGGVRLKLTVMRPPALVRTARGNGGSLCLACLAQRSDTVPPAECEEPDVFSEPSLGEELGSPCRSGVPRVGKAALKAVAQPDVGALRQHIQDLKAQLLNANKVIQSLQRRTRSISVTSGYTSGTERPPLCPTVPASPPHSLTDEARAGSQTAMAPCAHSVTWSTWCTVSHSSRHSCLLPSPGMASPRICSLLLGQGMARAHGLGMDGGLWEVGVHASMAPVHAM